MAEIPPSVDGVQSPQTSPPPPPPSPVPPKKMPGTSRGMLILISSIAGGYVIGGIVLLMVFPTTNTSLWWMKSIGSLVYLLGMMLWFLVGGFALYRVAMFKSTNIMMKAKAAGRVLAIVAPTLIISASVLLLIDRDPNLPINIIDPPSLSDAKAPLSITFGTQTARRVLQEQGLLPQKYSWDFNGDKQIDQVTSEPEITAYFPRSGIFTVTSTVQLTNNTTRLLSTTIRIPTEVFSVSPEKPILNEPTTFSLSHLFDDPEEFQRAQWDFDGDGTVDVETDSMDATFTYRRLGELTAKATIIYANNSSTTISRALSVEDPPPLPFPVKVTTLPPTLLGTAPFGVTFQVETQEPIANVTWSFGEEGSAEGLIAQRPFNKVGNYPVTAVIRSESGETATITKLVRVTEPLRLGDLRFSGEPEVRGFKVQGEQPLQLNLTPNTSTPLVSFSWDAPDASDVQSTDKTLIATFRKIGTWTVELIGVDAEQKVLRQPITVVVDPPESSVEIAIDPPTPVAPATVRFDASQTFIPGKEITGYEWSFGDKSPKERLGAITEHVYKEPGTYTIRLDVKTVDGSTFSETKVLVVRTPSFDVCFIPSRTEGDAPMGVRFDTSCSTGNFVEWEWDFGDGTQSDERDVVNVFEEPAEYTVTLKGTMEDGTTGTETVIITVN